MKKAFLAAITVMLLALPSYAQEEKPGDEIRKLQTEMRELRDEIGRLHLLNLLDLSLEQMQQMKALLDNLRLARELLNQQSLSHQKEMVELLKKLRTELAQGATELPEELVSRYDELRKANAEAGRDFNKKLKEADEELSALLTPEQGEIIKKYEGDILRPARDGPQDSDSQLAQVAKMLDRARSMSERELEQAGDKLKQQFLGRLAKGGNLPPQRIQAARRKMDDIIRQAREMDEFEYMLWREEFAKQVVELTNPPNRAARRDTGRQKGPQLSKAATLLLTEGMVEALEARIEILKKAQEEKQPEPENEEQD